jgi:hypothetical protein
MIATEIRGTRGKVTSVAKASANPAQHRLQPTRLRREGTQGDMLNFVLVEQLLKPKRRAPETHVR